MNESYLSVFHSAQNHARGKCSRNSIRGSLCFQLVFLVSSKTLYNIHVTWFDRFLRRKADSITLQYIHSCFHNLAKFKTKLQLKHLWEWAGGPWCFGGPTQLAYSVYRDRLWLLKWHDFSKQASLCHNCFETFEISIRGDVSVYMLLPDLGSVLCVYIKYFRALPTGSHKKRNYFMSCQFCMNSNNVILTGTYFFVVKN